jgi:hypothetical protein
MSGVDLCIYGKCLEWMEKPKVVTENLDAVWGSSASDVWVVGTMINWKKILHFDGSSWTTTPASWGLLAIFGTSSSNVWTGGFKDQLLRYDGQKWTINPIPNGCHPRSIWIESSGNNIWTVCDKYYGLLYSSDKGSTWTAQGVWTGGTPVAVWGTSTTDVWAVGNNGQVAHRGAAGSWSFSSISEPGGSTLGCIDVWGSSPGDYWAVGVAAIPTSPPTYVQMMSHYDGKAWSPATLGGVGRFQGVWGSSSSNVFAVGWNASGGVIKHFDGTKWSSVKTGIANCCKDVFGPSSTDVWVVGENGTMLHLE